MKAKNKSGKPASFRIRLAGALSVPPETFGGVSEVTVSEAGEISVSRCCRVDKYTETEICLCLCRSRLLITGSALLLHTYYDGHITVSGTVDTVSFLG